MFVVVFSFYEKNCIDRSTVAYSQNAQAHVLKECTEKALITNKLTHANISHIIRRRNHQIRNIQVHTRASNYKKKKKNNKQCDKMTNGLAWTAKRQPIVVLFCAFSFYAFAIWWHGSIDLITHNHIKPLFSISRHNISFHSAFMLTIRIL